MISDPLFYAAAVIGVVFLGLACGFALVEKWRAWTQLITIPLAVLVTLVALLESARTGRPISIP